MSGRALGGLAWPVLGHLAGQIGARVQGSDLASTIMFAIRVGPKIKVICSPVPTSIGGLHAWTKPWSASDG
jgi:hypothetical protein